MMIQHIEGCTRTLGKSQGYLGLPIADVMLDDGAGGTYPAMVSAWEPDPEEMKRLAAGAKVYLRIVGTDLCPNGHPPVMLAVGEVPE